MPDAPTVPLAEVADRYTIERELGRGATAVVYLARDRSTARSVALKVLRPELAESLSADRFLREIRVTQTLTHPHIAPVLDSGVSGGLFYCVLDYMDGGTLRDRLDRERQLPMADIAAITRAVGSALDYAHRNRIIHRDVKPENILFGGVQACLADFGIARALETLGGPTTSTGVVRGTPAYMSPEQASGEREYDGRSDVYSLACVLYEAIAGVPAFAGPNTQAILAQRLIHVPRPLHVYRPTVTAELDAVMARALATAPSDRYQTAASFAEALCTAIDNAASPAAVTAEQSAANARARSARRRRWIWGAGAAAVATAVVALGPLRGSMPWASNASLARREWLRGQHAVDSWRFDDADSAFAHAMALDSAFPQPALALAMVRSWSGEPVGRWRVPLDLATARPVGLAARETTIAAALQAQTEQAWDRACQSWRTLTAADRTDFAAWFGLARCLGADDAVVRDAASPSGWRFRASGQEMVQAYRRAFELHATVPTASKIGAFERVRDLLYTRSDQRRRGVTSPGGMLMLAAPDWAADTLAFVPYEYDSVLAGASGSRSPTTREALIAERRLLQEIASAWVAAAPASSDALESLAFAMKLLGDRAALDTLRRARALASTPRSRRRLAADEVWFRITISVPDDLTGLNLVHAIADSILADTAIGDPDALDAVAALLGRAGLAARLGAARTAPVGQPVLPDAAPLLAYAALGGPVDTVRRLALSVATAIDATVLKQEQPRMRQQWLEHAAELSYPDVNLAELQRSDLEGDPLLGAQAAFTAGHRNVAQQYLDGSPALRSFIAPENLSLDGLYPEARLLSLLGDSLHAANLLDPTLQALARMDPQVLARLTNAAALVRSAVLRAELAASLHDSLAAAKWARVVTVLWSGADPFLQPIVQRMGQLARGFHSDNRRQ